MSLLRYRIFIGMLVGWALLLVGMFIHVQSATNWGADLREMTSVWQLNHEYWYGVLNSSIVIIPGLTGCWWTAKRYGGFSSRIGQAIIVLTAGCILWGFGNVIWFYTNVVDLLPEGLQWVTADDIVYPSYPDIGYLMILPFSAVGLFLLTRVIAVPGREYLKLAWIPVLTGIVTVWILVFAFGEYVNPHETAAESITSATYIASDVILMSLALMLMIFSRRAAGGTFFPPMIGYAVGMVFLWMGDMLFFPRVYFSSFPEKAPESGIGHFLFQGYYNGDISDFVYGLAIFGITFGTFLFARAEQKTLAQMREFEAMMNAQTEDADGSAV